MNTNRTIVVAHVDRASEILKPLYRRVRGKLRACTGHLEPACRTYKKWFAIHETPSGFWRTDDPRRVIPQLIRGRISGPPYPNGKPLYIMSAAQALDFVGVAEPTVLHLQLAADALTDLLGEPKKVYQRDRWLINPRGNDDALNPLVARKFPVPARRTWEFDWDAAAKAEFASRAAPTSERT